MFDPAENNRLPLRKSFHACPSRRPVVIPNIDLVDYAYQFECYPHQCKVISFYDRWSIPFIKLWRLETFHSSFGDWKLWSIPFTSFVRLDAH
ncbi:hypothetical protein ACFX15_029869 [Malus domestica]